MEFTECLSEDALEGKAYFLYIRGRVILIGTTWFQLA